MHLVSFVIAAFNEEKYIRECIESCLAQDYENVEVCITDDGSTDSTREILVQYSGDERVRIRSFDKNRGKVAAFNSSYSMARGEYIAIMGADDVACADRISVSMREINKYSFVFGDLSSFSEQGLIEPSIMGRRFGKKKADEVGFCELLESPCVYGGTILAERNALDRVFPLNEQLTHEDWWVPLCCARDGPLRYVHHLMIHYRMHEGQTSNTTLAGRREGFVRWKALMGRERFYYEQVRLMSNLSSRQKSLIDGKVLLIDCVAEKSLLNRLKLWCRMIVLGRSRTIAKGFLCSLHPKLYHWLATSAK